MKTWNNNEKPLIYVVDDDPTTLKVVSHKLEKSSDKKVKTFRSADACLKEMKSNLPDLVLCDYYLAPMNERTNSSESQNGDYVLKSIKEKYPETPIIMYSSSRDLGLGINLVKDGAYDFLFRDGGFFIQLENSVDSTISHLPKSTKSKHSTLQIVLWSTLIIGFLFLGFHFIYHESQPIYGLTFIAAGLTFIVLASQWWKKPENYDQSELWEE